MPKASQLRHLSPLKYLLSASCAAPSKYFINIFYQARINSSFYFLNCKLALNLQTFQYYKGKILFIPSSLLFHIHLGIKKALQKVHSVSFCLNLVYAVACIFCCQVLPPVLKLGSAKNHLLNSNKAVKKIQNCNHAVKLPRK